MAACEGCGEPGATTELWYPAWAGSHPVALHANRACAETARDRLGGKRFLSEQDVRLLKGVRLWAEELQREAKR